jgi:glycosyltransferase involved in cell wall biosynthesis
MQTTTTPDITLALPAYNESDNIATVLDACVAALNRTGRTWEIIVIDNHSSDDTPARVRDYTARQPGVRLVVHDTNKMYSGSCRTAMQEARGRYVAIMDSDGQMDPNDLPAFLAPLEAGGADIVFGWRRQRHDPAMRLVISMFFNLLGKWRIGFPLHDLNCGLRMFTRRFCETAEIRHTINMANPELYVRARQHGFRLAEMEVRHMARAGGKTSHNLGRLWRIFLDVDRYMRALAQDLRGDKARNR